ncbi:BspA family leucine-rich repeat surface protein [Porphyromonas sp. COT-239 OH1446]|uniref:BspA family leucine-rich repeat surface protein n=1 Tax=Porphyromonas sp. COT-239 OH1446 TaxID=1515613 RepID=UPI001362231C|nr:BspA family leucine-rich repeat surface protein [Porphyromonas sp. COT-239 OH1446]
MDIEELIKSKTPLKRDARLPLSLSLPLEDEQETRVGVGLEGHSPNNPSYLPERDWSRCDWHEQNKRPHILVAISNANHKPSPTGGVWEKFKHLRPEEYDITPRSGKAPKVFIKSNINIPQGRVLSEFKVSVMVIDSAHTIPASFEQDGTFDLNLTKEFSVLKNDEKRTDNFSNLVFVLPPIDLKDHVGPRTSANPPKTNLRFELLSTVLVIEFADPENMGGSAPYKHVQLETGGFTHSAKISMKGIDNTTPRSVCRVLPSSKALKKDFQNVFQGASSRYVRAITMALPIETTQPTYNFKATYRKDGGASPKVRSYDLKKKPMVSKGKMVFIDFEIEEAPLDKAKYFQTKWNTGSDGKIIFYAAGIHNRNNEKIASTHKAKFYYRKSNSPSSAWTPFRINEPKLSEWDERIQPQKVELTGLDANTDYDIWMKNLSYFSLVDWTDYSSYGSLNPDIKKVTLWGTSNEWGTGGHIYSDSEKVCPLCFVRATELEVTAKDKPNFKHLKCADAMFAGAERFTGTPNINEWDMSSVVSMKNMFQGATSFNTNISSWNVSNVKNMSSMFEGATSFNADIFGWNVSNVTDMSSMFKGATSFNTNISGWNVSNVTTMASMFSGATSFNADISGWNVSNVTYMSYMFEEATNFNQNLTAWNISNVIEMSSMFKSATRFNQDLLWGEKFKNVRFAGSMFNSARAFNGDISAWDTSSLQNADSMFESAVAFNRDISGWNVSKLKRMVGMFRFASAFNRNLGRWVFPNNAQIEMLFGGSGMSEANIQATLQGWERTALENPNVMTDALMTISSNVSNDSWNGKTNAEIRRILSWFRANRDWILSPYYSY